jgi:hypothetical protein
MMRKCEWCHKDNDELKEISILSTNLSAANRREISYFVCPEHERKLRRFYDRVRRYNFLFLGLIAIFLFGLIAPTIYFDNHWSVILPLLSFASLGLLSILFPFCTPETIAMIGVAKSIMIVRIFGVVIFALGAIGLLLGLLYG